MVKRLCALLVLVLLLAPQPVFAAFAEVGSGSQRASANGANIGSLNITYPGNVASGSLLIGVCVGWASGGMTGVLDSLTDTVSTSYTAIVGDEITLGSGTFRLFIFYGVSTSAGANTVAFNPAGVSGLYMSCSINEFSGQHGTPLSVSSTTPNTGTSPDPTASLTTLTSGELVIAIAGHGDGSAPSLAVDAPSTQFGEKETDNTDMAHSAGYRIGGAAGSHAVDFTVGTSVVWGTLTASFKAADGEGGATCRSGLLLLGAGGC
jgi:hypothetical protein